MLTIANKFTPCEKMENMRAPHARPGPLNLGTMVPILPQGRPMRARVPCDEKFGINRSQSAPHAGGVPTL